MPLSTYIPPLSNLPTASSQVANLCLLSKDTFRYPKRVGEFTRPRVKKVVPHRGSSCRTTRGPLFAGGPQSFRHPADRQPHRYLRKVPVAHYTLLSARGCERQQIRQHLRLSRAG